jgi:hypothetical protein
MLATNVQKWAEELLREGVQQGIHRGQHEGKLWALRQLLRVRFPEADLTPYQSRLDAATDAELEHLLTKAATAATLEEVFATQ